METNAKKRAAMLVTDGFEEIEAVGTYAILARGGVAVDVYSLRDGDATGRFGLTLARLLPFSTFSAEGYDLLVLPGGPEYRAIEADPRAQAAIRAFVESGKLVGAICAGPTILGRAGYLKDKHYTCFTSMNEDFGGAYLEDYAVTDGKIVTGKSAAATVHFGFALLEALLGPDAADRTKSEIYFEE